MDSLTFKNELLPYYDTAYRTAFNIVHDSDNARDIVQELFRRLWEQHSKLKLPDSPRAFCATAARNAALSWLRNNPTGRQAPLDEHLAETTPAEDSTDERSKLLNNAIIQLDKRRQTLIQLSLEGHSNDEIANKLNISPENLRALLSRTRRQLRQIILSLAET